MNPQEVNERLHGKTYDSKIWKLLQIKKYINPTLSINDCPKDYNIYYLHKTKVLKVFGESIPVKGLIRIPVDNMYIETDRYKSGEVVKRTQVDHISRYAFRTDLFMATEAKRYRKHVCDVCPLNECSFKIRRKK